MQVSLDIEIHQRIIGSVLTLYMLALTLRWVAPFIELDLHNKKLSWIPRITDPLIKLVRQLMPDLGPVDLSPAIAIVGVWFVRLVVLKY